jgi:thioredoxin 1
MEDEDMSEISGQTGTESTIRYELILTAEEARQGTSKTLPRRNKHLQVNIPAGVSTGSVVKLTNALQVTDGQAGDILISIKVQAGESAQPESAPAGVVEINDANFESEVLQSGLPVVVDFWAAWCGPCRMMSPVVEEAAKQYQGKYKFCKINVDENPGMASRYQAMSIPMLLFFKNGQVVDRSVGAIPAAQLRARLDELLHQ